MTPQRPIPAVDQHWLKCQNCGDRLLLPMDITIDKCPNDDSNKFILVRDPPKTYLECEVDGFQIALPPGFPFQCPDTDNTCNSRNNFFIQCPDCLYEVQ